jgi:hypothetical protein
MNRPSMSDSHDLLVNFVVLFNFSLLVLESLHSSYIAEHFFTYLNQTAFLLHILLIKSCGHSSETTSNEN